MAVESKTSIEKKLSLNVYKLDKEAHIKVDVAKCRKCVGKYCLYVCPANLFTRDENGDIKFDFEGCLECGTCLIACKECGIDWNYPKGGFGVQYRFG
jgi:ferredoxin like protein